MADVLLLRPTEGSGFAPSASLNVAIELSAFGGNCQVMHQDIPNADPEALWEKIPLRANLDALDSETILKIMERLELAYRDGERELNGLN